MHPCAPCATRSASPCRHWRRPWLTALCPTSATPRPFGGTTCGNPDLGAHVFIPSAVSWLLSPFSGRTEKYIYIYIFKNLNLYWYFQFKCHILCFFLNFHYFISASFFLTPKILFPDDIEYSYYFTIQDTQNFHSYETSITTRGTPAE